MPLSNGAYMARTSAQYRLRSRRETGSTSVSLGVNRSDSTRAFRLGWDVRPDIDAIAPSATSRPTSAASITLAAWAPPMSWVWKWIGMPTSFLSASTSFAAAYGLHNPAMSLMAIRLAPRFSRSLAIEM